MSLLKDFVPNDLDCYDTIIFDIDGVICNGSNDFISGSLNVLNRLITNHNKRVILCTNNSTKHRNDYFEFFSQLPLDPTHLYTAASTLASQVHALLAADPNPDAKVLLIGEPGLFQECADRGIREDQIVRIETLTSPMKSLKDLTTVEISTNIAIVAIGLSAKWDYVSCALVEIVLQDLPTIKMLATSRVCTTTVSKTRQIPAVGAILHQLEHSLPGNIDPITQQAKKQFIPMGKPHTSMFEAMCRDFPSIDPTRTLMVGDRLDSDVAFGLACGLDTLLVFSGVTNEGYYRQRREQLLMMMNGDGCCDLSSLSSSPCPTTAKASNIISTASPNPASPNPASPIPSSSITMDKNSEAVIDKVFPTYCGADITCLLPPVNNNDDQNRSGL